MTVITPAERKILEHMGLARQTWASSHLPELEQMTHALMGLTGEIAEAQAMVADAYEARRADLGENPDTMATELGDVYYYLLRATDLAGGTLPDLAGFAFDDLPGYPGMITQGQAEHEAHQILAIYFDTTGSMQLTELEAMAYYLLGLGSQAGQAQSIATKARYKPGRELDKPAILGHLAQVYKFLLLAIDVFEYDLASLGDLVFAKLYHGHGWTEGRQGGSND